MRNKLKIAVAMSGGVDSSVAAHLLKEEGFDVIGVNLNLWSCFKTPAAKSCCSPEDRRDARNVCETIGIPFVAVDMRGEFRKKIVEQFVCEYSKGRTPNPCIRCNTLIKFGSLLNWLAKEMGIDRLATGHYAQIVKDKKGVHLKKGADHSKDQSYFLFDNPSEVLSHLHFPLGSMTKSDAREIAARAALPVAEKSESQEVCFVPDNDVPGFIEDYYSEHAGKKGDFVDKEGKRLGRHRGTHAYTIGQRRGLGIGFGERKYVTAIEAESGRVVLGDDEDLMKGECMLDEVTLIETRGDSFSADVKIRYRSPAVPAKISILNDKGAKIEFEEPVRAVTPGQAAVFYDGELVIGGGWIR